MKNLLRFSLLALLMTVFNSAWADDVTVSMSSFSAISGNVNDDPNISYAAAKGNAGTAPAVNNGEIRVYQNGGLFTVSANNGAKIKSVTLGSSMATSVTCSVDGGSAGEAQSIVANGSLTVDNLNCSSILFTCVGTDKSHRLYVNYLSVTYAPPTTQTVATPTFSPEGGEFTTAQSVAISCATDGATVYYTLNGNEPTTNSIVYSAPISIEETTTVKAIAVKEGMNNSSVASATYTIITPIPGYTINFESDASAYVDWEFTNMLSNQSGNITAHGGSCYGTTGGKYTASITTTDIIATPQSLTCYVSKLTGNTTASTWKIQVSDDGSTWTEVAKQSATGMSAGEWKEFTANLSSYTNVYVGIFYEGTNAVRAIDDLTLDTTGPAVATPTFSPEGGEYEEAQTVTISCDTEDATIYYTLDGSEPTTESSVYSAPISIEETTTVKAIAYVGTDASSVAEAIYTIIDPNAPGTENNPYTVAQARAAIDAGTGVTGVFATGIVSEIVTPYNSQFGNITYNISADGTTTSEQLQAYRGKSYNGANFTSEDDIQVGDAVVIYGNLTMFGDTYEFAQNNQLVQLTRPEKVCTITTELTELEVGVPIRWEDFTITYAEGVDEDDVDVDYEASSNFFNDLEQGLVPTEEGTATITFTFTYNGEGNYSDVEKTFTFNVVDNRLDPEFAFTPNTITIVQGEDFEKPVLSSADDEYFFDSGLATIGSDNPNVAYWDAENGLQLGEELGTAVITVTYNGSEDSHLDGDYKSGEATLTVTVVDELPTEVTATFDATIDLAETGSTAGEWSITKDGLTISADGGVGGNGTDYRIYKNTTFTVSCTVGKITKIEFSADSSNPVSGFGEVEGLVGNTWTGNAKSVSFTASNKQVRLTLVNITYEPAFILSDLLNEKTPYTNNEDKQVPMVIYKREFSSRTAGHRQCWFVPFNYTITDEDIERCTFYRILMFSAPANQEGVVQDENKVVMNIVEVSSGYTLNANKPYIIKPKTAGVYEFVAENATLKAKDTGSLKYTSTSTNRYDFYGVYDSYSADAAKQWFSLNTNGNLLWNAAGQSLGAYRWYITSTYTGDDYANIVFVIDEDSEGDETTAIEQLFNNPNAEIEGLYTVDGIKLYKPAKGLNIVKYTDGRTKKVYIK